MVTRLSFYKTTYFSNSKLHITYFNENEKLTDEQRQVVIEHISFPYNHARKVCKYIYIYIVRHYGF